MGWVANAKPRPLYPRKRDLIPMVQEAGCAPGSIWMGAETGFYIRTIQSIAIHCTSPIICMKAIKNKHH